MTTPKFTQEQWEEALADTGSHVEFDDAQKAIIEVLEGNLEADKIIKSIDLSLRLLSLGVKVNYDFSPEQRSFDYLLQNGLRDQQREFLVNEALESIIAQ